MTKTDLIMSLRQQLLEAYVSKDDAQTKIRIADERIQLIRALLAGIDMTETTTAESSPPTD